MFRPTVALTLTLLACLLGCSSEDPRLPDKLYMDAVKVNQEGRLGEARMMMEQVAARFPDHPTGIQARRDLYLLEVGHQQELKEKERTLRTLMRRAGDALRRYHAKKGEYPSNLLDLVPEYTDRVPVSPWGHPFLYRPYVDNPVEIFRGQKGQASQRYNQKYDRYVLICLGTDLLPGGKGLAADVILENGEFVRDQTPPPQIPENQPIR